MARCGGRGRGVGRGCSARPQLALFDAQRIGKRVKPELGIGAVKDLVQKLAADRWLSYVDVDQSLICLGCAAGRRGARARGPTPSGAGRAR